MRTKRIAWLCLLLTLWSAVAVATHHHANGLDSVKCTVCVAAHSAAPTTVSHLGLVTSFAISTLKAEPVSAKQHIAIFALSVRPPPEA